MRGETGSVLKPNDDPLPCIEFGDQLLMLFLCGIPLLPVDCAFPDQANVTLTICSETGSTKSKSEAFHPTSLSRKLNDTRLSESKHSSRPPKAPAAPTHCLAASRTVIQQHEHV